MANSDLITALYKNGELKSVKNTPLYASSETTLSFNMIAGDADTAKVFIWESINNIKSLCEAKTIYIE